MHRSFRRLVATVTLLGLLVVQGMVAAHACTAIFEAAAEPVPVAAMADCTGMHEGADAALCIQHCGRGHDANSTLSTADFPALVLTAYLTVEHAGIPVTAATLAATRPAARSTSPPPLLLSQRLRI